ncbi:DUF2971 domain-containing protein [Dyadobacter bucti]|uniref:DUF2971 domain-containing protein n=1 Tax=Dyadobacter bucti TaxID=2572203 RepID=UPI001109B9CE|nr:DUF2971 domain-containing protein [Dyadobacter bucti]
MSIRNQESGYPTSDYRSRNFSGVWQKHFINEYVDKTAKVGLEAAVTEMANYKTEHFPKLLYKFFGPSHHSLVSLENNLLWLNSPRSFNDPFDSYVCIERMTFIKKYILKELEKMRLINKEGSIDTLSNKEMWEIRHSYSEEEICRPGNYYLNREYFGKVLSSVLSGKSENFKILIENLELEARQAFRKTINAIREVDVRITCFSNFEDEQELAANTTMWSHYASNHTGFCIRYSLEKTSDFVKTGLLPVKYTSNVPTLSVPNILETLNSNHKFSSNLSIAKASKKALITKSAFWSYEKEWRLMVENERVDLLNNNCIAFPYAEAIFMGCRIESSLKYHLVSFAEKSNLKVFETRPNEERFVLDIFETDLNKVKEDTWIDEVLLEIEGTEDEQRLYRNRLYKRRYDQNRQS